MESMQDAQNASGAVDKSTAVLHEQATLRTALWPLRGHQCWRQCIHAPDCCVGGAGRYQDAIEAIEEARGMLDEQACAGLSASFLSQQAAGHLGRGQHDRALGCLQRALALQPTHSPSLLLRAQV